MQFCRVKAQIKGMAVQAVRGKLILRPWLLQCISVLLMVNGKHHAQCFWLSLMDRYFSAFISLGQAISISPCHCPRSLLPLHPVAATFLKIYVVLDGGRTLVNSLWSDSIGGGGILSQNVTLWGTGDESLTVSFGGHKIQLSNRIPANDGVQLSKSFFKLNWF